ncbi:MAG: excinuclease ABC subunit UvrC, partial [Treponemataceae bacterium]
QAPCCNKVSKKTYNNFIEEISRLLEGEDTATQKKIEKDMKAAAKNLQFEKAARLRDGLSALKLLYSQNSVEDFDPEGRDYIAFAAEGTLVTFAILKMRHGKLIARDIYRLRSLNSEDELLNEFLLAYYVEKSLIPPSIFVQSEDSLQLTKSFFEQTFDAQVNIYCISASLEHAKRHQAAILMAQQNALEDIKRRIRERGDTAAMEELMKLLNLAHLPVRIEGFDIAHLHGKFPVASLISFYNGNPDKKGYRMFRLKTTEGIIDDFASMREVAHRRYSRILSEQSEFPDLILIDGGIGQVNAVDEVLNDLGLTIPIVGLAKQDEQLYVPHNSTPIQLPKRSDALRLLQRVRDETHRFATTRNQRLRTKENTYLTFENIPNVGKVRAKQLLDTFESLENLAVAEPKAVYSVAHCSEQQAREIIESAQFLHNQRKLSEKTHKKDNRIPKADKNLSNLAEQALKGKYE